MATRWDDLVPISAAPKAVVPPAVRPVAHRKALPVTDTSLGPAWDELVPTEQPTKPQGLGSPTTPSADAAPTRNLADLVRGSHAAPRPTTGLFDRIKQIAIGDDPIRDIGIGTRGVIEGVGDAFGFFTNPISLGLNKLGIPQALTGQRIPYANEPSVNIPDKLGLPQAETPVEKLGLAINRGGTGGLAFGPLGGVATRTPGITGQFLKFLTDAPIVNSVGGAAASTAQEATAQAGGSEMAQLAAGLAGGLVGGGGATALAHGAPALRQWWKARGVATDRFSDADLVSASLDGGIDGKPMAPNDVDAILKGAGASPDQFSTPEAAKIAADRISTRQATPAPNLAESVAGVPKKQAAKLLDELIANGPTSRTVPNDTTIIGAPEGNVRSDDPGAIAGLERKRAADSNVLSTAQERVASDPVVSQILNSNVSPQTKIKTLWDRINKTSEDIRNAPLPDPVEPWRQPTSQAARESGTPFERMLRVEGGTNRDGSFRTSPKGAIGPAQVMPQTGPEAARLAGLPWDEKRFHSDPNYNKALGKAYHEEMLRRFNGDEALAAAAYNAGPGRVEYAVKKGGPLGWQQYVPQETRDYVRKVFGGELPNAKQEPAPYRIQAPDNQEGDGFYSAASPVARDINDPSAGPIRDNFAGFEDTRRPTSPTNAEREAGKVYRTGQRGDQFTDRPTSAPFESRIESGYSDRAFRATADDPQGQPGFWEGRARDQFKAKYDKAQADLEAEWLRRREEQAQRRANAGADDRFTNERTQAGPDPQTAYGGKYDQKPHKDGEFFRTTEDGYVAGKAGNPVAFRNAREAAKFAASNELGGDFELHSYGSQDKAGNQRIVLRRRDGSTYGQAKPETNAGSAPQGDPVRTNFERTIPPAGRSSDTSQRAVGGPEQPAPPPQPASAPYRAPRAAGADSGAVPTQQVVTPRGRALDTRFEVVDAKDLVTSDHPSFDQRLQPRDRGTRAASDAQIADIASRLDPEQLHSARLASHGAPIVGPDHMVESGNGRVSAIRRAYDLHPERAAEYRAMVERQGFDTTGIEKPVLVRRRVTHLSDEERAAFAREGQDNGTMEMSRSEKVKADAKTISTDTLKLYRGGDVEAAGNRDFVRRWMDEVISPSERNAMVRPDGTLSADGIQRLRGTLLAKAFDDPDLIEKIVSDPNSEIKAIGNALTEAAPAFAELKAKIEAGELPREYDITPKIAEVANLIARARSEGKSVGELLKQSDIFTGEVDPLVETVAGIMFRNGGFKQPRSAASVGEALRFYTDEAGKAADAIKQGDGLFGAVEPVKPLEIAQAARERLLARDDAAKAVSDDLFGGSAKRVGPGGRSSERTSSRLKDELGKIANEAPTPEGRELASRLVGLVGDDANLFTGRHMMNPGELGRAEPSANAAFVRDAGDFETTLHEAIHLAAIRRYGAGFAALEPGDLAASPVRDLLKVFNEARAQYKRGGFATRLTTQPHGIGHALSTPDEFLAMALTNRSTQRFLQHGSLWDRVVDGVRKLLGFEPRFKPMLDRALQASREILDAAKSDPDRAAGADPALSKDFFKAVADQVYDGEDIARDFQKFRASVKSPVATLKAVTAPLTNAASGLVFTNDGVMRSLAARFKSDAITELADNFLARSGKGDGTARTYHEAVTRASTVRIQEAANALKPFMDSAASMERIRKLLTHPKDKLRAAPAEIEAATKLRELLKETIDYRKAAGEDVGEVTDGYFPRVLDVAKVSKNRDEFLRRAEKLYAGLDVKDPRAAAEAWFQRAFDTYSGLDGGLSHVRQGAGGMGGNTAKAREFGKEADAVMRDFYHDDVFQTLASYFTGAARRAEEARRFGPKGAVGSAERDAWVKDHQDKTQLEVLNDRIKADVLASGVDAGDLLHRLKKATDANLGRFGSVSHNTRTMISYAHAWNQLGKLDRTTVTSLGELTMGFIRGGPKYGVSYVKDSAVEFARQLAGAHPSDAARWAEAIGVAQDSMVNQALTSRISAEGATHGVQKVLSGFYRGILLHQFTEGERIAASRMGRHMLQTLAGDMASPKARVRVRAERYLKELGVKDTQGFSEMLRKGEPSLDDVRRDAPGLASDYATALIRFVNQTVIAPSRAEKPAIAAHPVGSLFTSLLGYNYGFKKNVLDRAGRMAVDAVKDRDPHLLLPAAALPIMAVFQYFNDTYLRTALYGSNYDFSTETPTETALRVADRAGFTGPLSPVINAFKGIKYRRSLAETAAGTVIGSGLNSASKIIEPFVGNNSPDTNTAERNSAAALYDAVVEPVIDATASKYLKGIPRTAVVMGTGNKRGGILPGDKDAFTDAVGGPKE